MIALLFLSLALAMDAFAVSLVRGAAGQHSIRHALETGLTFGAAQGIMPLLGWALGSLFLVYIEAWDHWIAFALLAFLGVQLLREGLGNDGDDDDVAPASNSYKALLAAAIATSIDAGAAGLTLDLFAYPPLLSCLVIAVVTAALCVPAYWFAARLGPRLGKRAEVFGGLVLIGLGIRIVAEHIGWL